MIYDKGGFELPFKGIVTLSDFETSRQMVLDGFSKETKKEFTAAREAACKRTLGVFSKARSDVIELETGASVSDTLQKYFRQRERRIR